MIVIEDQSWSDPSAGPAQGLIRVIRIERPEKANSLTREMLVAIAEAAEGAQGAGCHALILTGTGKVFSAGADLEAARQGLAVDDIWERVSGAIAAFPGLSIAALNGTLAGGAFGMALACDLRLGVEGANFFYPVMRLGYLPQPSDPARLVALVGAARARLILVAADKLTAQEALAFGLIERIVPREGLLDAAIALAAPACAGALAHVKAIKDMTRPAG